MVHSDLTRFPSFYLTSSNTSSNRYGNTSQRVGTDCSIIRRPNANIYKANYHSINPSSFSSEVVIKSQSPAHFSFLPTIAPIRSVFFSILKEERGVFIWQHSPHFTNVITSGQQAERALATTGLRFCEPICLTECFYFSWLTFISILPVFIVLLFLINSQV